MYFVQQKVEKLMLSASFPARWMKHRHLMSLCSLVAAFALILTACSTSSTPDTSTSTTTSTTPTAQGPGAFGLGALPGYTITRFANPSTAYTAPDSVVVLGSHIFVGYQNVT